MATINWPSTLPQSFKRDSYQEEMIKNVIASEFEAGPAGLRPRVTQNVFLVSGEMFMTTEEWEDLQLFLTEETLDRSLCFDFPEQGAVDSGGRWLVLMDKPPSRSWLAEDFWLVSLSFVVLPGYQANEITTGLITDGDTIYAPTMVFDQIFSPSAYSDTDTIYPASLAGEGASILMIDGASAILAVDGTTLLEVGY